MTLALRGTGISNGIAIGRVLILERNQCEIKEYHIAPQHIADEIARFQSALDTARRQLRAVYKHIPPNTASDIAAFIDTHLLMLDDSALVEVPINIIGERHCNAEWALKLQQDALASVFEEMDDPYLRTRRDDIDHVVNRIQRVLLKQAESPHELPDSRLSGRIILADDLTPADTVLILHQGIAAFVTEYGGPTSHTAILARSLRIPAIVGLRHARRYIEENDLLIIDGQQGVILADPDERTLKYYRKRRTEVKRYQSELAKLKDKPSITADGVPVTLLANIELPEDIPAIKRVAAAGVGLYRTEFLFMNRADTPDEEEHLQAYLRVVKALHGAPVTIRTLDLGADKQVDGGRQQAGPVVTNPALGLRAVRLCLKDPSLFIPQLRAILRASAHGPIRILIPMLSNTNELAQVLRMVAETKRELAKQGLAFDDQIPIGGMIEIPAAAISADSFARQLDFLSIGTNDLIQYTLAIDRIDDDVNYLYDPLHPAVLRLIQMTIDAGNKARIPISMCGEMAGDARYTRLLLGMGLRELSMHPASVLRVKKIVNESNVAALTKGAKKILRTTSHSQIMELLDKLNAH